MDHLKLDNLLNRIQFLILLLAVGPIVGHAQDARGLWVAGEATAQDEESTEPDSALKVEDAWARPGRGAAKTGAAFLKITNTGKEPDRLTQAVSDVAENVELHESYRDGNVMRMRRVESMVIPANGVLELKPGGYHIMLIGVRQNLTAGETFSMDLIFEKAAKQTLQVKVREE